MRAVSLTQSSSGRKGFRVRLGVGGHMAKGYRAITQSWPVGMKAALAQSCEPLEVEGHPWLPHNQRRWT